MTEEREPLPLQEKKGSAGESPCAGREMRLLRRERKPFKMHGAHDCAELAAFLALKWNVIYFECP